MSIGDLVAELARRVTVLEDKLDEANSGRIDDDDMSEPIELSGDILATTVNGRPVIAIDRGKAARLTLLDEHGYITIATGSGGEGRGDEGRGNGFQVRDYAGRIVARLQTFDERGSSSGGMIFTLGGNPDRPCASLSVLVKNGSIIVTDRPGEVVFRVPSA